MKKYFFIAIGGFSGAISRSFLEGISVTQRGYFPWNTLLINITGSMLLAFFLTLVLDFCFWDKEVRLGLTTGFLGAYTTFATFCRETCNLLSNNHFISAICYLFLSAFSGLFFAYLGFSLANILTVKWQKMRYKKCNI